jgi:hypothetical protein
MLTGHEDHIWLRHISGLVCTCHRACNILDRLRVPDQLEDKKLNKRYVGKNFEDFRLRKIAKEIKVKPSLLIKFKFIEQHASRGNALAKQYLEKLRKEEVSIDWAHRVLINGIRQQRMLKMMVIADNRHFSYQNEDDLVDFIASDMQKEGLEVLI